MTVTIVTTVSITRKLCQGTEFVLIFKSVPPAPPIFPQPPAIQPVRYIDSLGYVTRTNCFDYNTIRL